MTLPLSSNSTMDEALDAYFQWDPDEKKLGAPTGDRDVRYRYHRPQVGVPSLFSERQLCSLLLLRGVVQDACHLGAGRYADDLGPTTVTRLLRGSSQPQG